VSFPWSTEKRQAEGVNPLHFYNGVNVGTDENRLSRGSHRLTRNILFLQEKETAVDQMPTESYRLASLNSSAIRLISAAASFLAAAPFKARRPTARLTARRATARLTARRPTARLTARRTTARLTARRAAARRTTRRAAARFIPRRTAAFLTTRRPRRRRTLLARAARLTLRAAELT
jgi:hypothetical protein